MTTIFRTFLVATIAAAGLIGQSVAAAAEQSLLEKDSRAALESLYAGSPGAKALGAKAKGTLVFPSVHKAGFVLGAQSGDGVLFVKGAAAAYYNTSAVSLGLQAGAQAFGYALFFMTDKALTDFRRSKNFQFGVGPNIVIIDAGAAKDINNLTVKSDIYAVIFNQKGLMAGIGLQGSKITKLGK